MNSVRRNVRWVACLSAAALVLGACGDSDDDEGSTSEPPASAETAAPTDTEAAPDTSAPDTAAPDTAAPTSDAEEAAETLTIDASSCPADATEPLADGEPIVLGGSLPTSGQFAAFGIAPEAGLRTYFNKINAEGGINGHQIELIMKDDGLDPARTVSNATELIEQDHVLANVYFVGTAQVQQTQSISESSCTPQMWVGSGTNQLFDAVNHPWTTVGQLSYSTEASVWATFIAEQSPGAKVAMLVTGNDFGASYETSFEAAAEELGLDVVEVQKHEQTATNVDGQVAAIIAAEPDFVVAGTSGPFCGRLMTGLAQGGYTGGIMLPAPCGSVQSSLVPVGEAADNAYVVSVWKDPTDERYADDPDMIAFKEDVAEFGGGASADDTNVLLGYSIGSLVVDNLQRAADSADGLTRVSLQNAAWSTTGFSLPLSVTSMSATVNGIDDLFAWETVQMSQYDAATQTLNPVGDVIDREGQTPLPVL